MWVYPEKETTLRTGIFADACRSGMSAAITMAMLRKFCTDGNEQENACNELRYDKDHKTTIFVTRNPDGELYLHFAFPNRRKDGTFFSPNAIKLSRLQFPEAKDGSEVKYEAGEPILARIGKDQNESFSG